MKISPIEHLSGRGYYRRKRAQIVSLSILGIAAACVLFYFSGKNLRHFLLIKSGIANFEKNKMAYALSDFNKAMNIKPNSALAIDGLA
ncbi:MAG TPA: hypothetical protein P5511_00205, partial [Candidatus Goldiibacteriota bacterium]|nr:hypothetical protein [Candidatus Goldiibacteriota bacterium]